jgi:ABC-2 type transport system permease protein
MPIFDQGYQHWNGHLASQVWRWWAISRQGVRAQLKNKMTRLWILVCFGPALALVGFMILWSLLEQGNQSIQTILQFLPQQFRDIPKDYRVTVWTLAYHIFFMGQLFMLMILVLLIGPGLISNDMRFNALPLYLSRPVRRWEYFLGKLGVIGTYVLLVTAVPATLARILGVLFSLSWAAVVEVFPILLGALAVSVIMALVLGLWMLALSSLSRNSRYVSMMWFGFWLITNILSGALFGILRTEDWPVALSLTRNVQRVEEALLDTENAWAKVDQGIRMSQEVVSRQVPIPRLPPGIVPNRINVPQQPPRGRFGVLTSWRTDSEGRVTVTERSGPFRSIFPWTWSAAALAALGVLALCILMFRVRSLDRPR